MCKTDIHKRELAKVMRHFVMKVLHHGGKIRLLALVTSSCYKMEVC